MNNICTSLEQSKKLMELGIDIDTADMHYSTWTILNEGEYILSPNQGETIEELQEDYGNQVIPAWSLAALLDILESEIDGEEGETYELNIEKDGTWWNIWYRERYDEADPIETTSTEELVDACVEMVIKPKEMDLL